MAGLTLDIAANTRDFIRGTDDVESALEKVSDSLDDAGEDGEKAAEKLERSFSDAQREISRTSKKIGKGIGDDVTDGTDTASEGMETLQQRAEGAAARTAASFDGSVKSIGDGFQRLSSKAFAGFGPAGAAAGVIAAAGLGLVTAEITKQQEMAAELAERFKSAYKAASEDGRDFLNEQQILAAYMDILWDDAKREDARAKSAEIGVTMTQYIRAQAGDVEALNAVVAAGTAAEQKRVDELRNANGEITTRVALGDIELNNLEKITQENQKLLDISNTNQQIAAIATADSREHLELIQKQNKALADTPTTVPTRLTVDDSELTAKLATSRTLRVIVDGYTRNGQRVV